MKKIYVPLLILAFVFAVPSLTNAQNSDGCTTLGAACTVAGYSGTCAQNPEYGNLYCRPTILNTSGGTSGGGINIGALKPYGDSIKGLINDILVPVLFAIAFIVFLWGTFKYFIWGADDEDARKTGRQFVLWGVIGFVVILALWGLVNLLLNILNLPGSSSPPTPPIIR